MSPSCFHCGLPNPAAPPYQAEIAGQRQDFCCPGCQAVAQAIDRAGLADYYRHRSQPGAKAQDVSVLLKEAALYDQPLVQQGFVQADGEHKSAYLIIEGLACAACVWLNERHVRHLPGVIEADINYSTARARVVWDDSRIQLSEIMAAIAAIGYRAYPFDPEKREQILEGERKTLLRRIFVAGLGMSQVMMISIGLYAGAHYGIEHDMRVFLQYVALLFTLPVMVYAAWPFLAGAWRDLRGFRAGMDVPVSLGLLATFAASVLATVRQEGAVYYDTVTMFVFFLLGARFLEMTARRKAAHAADVLSRVIPALARRQTAAGVQWVAVADLALGDCLLVQPGEVIPVDAELLEGQGDVDESLITGESRPVSKRPGDTLTGGTVNQDGLLRLRVTRLGEEMVVHQIMRLLDRAQAERPAIAHLVDRAAGWFVLAVLLLALAAGLYWAATDPARAYWIVVSILVVTCPCALGLATPVALTAATGRLAQAGVLCSRGRALETLAGVTHVVFDKTGTLSEGKYRLRESWVAPGATAAWESALALAALSEHLLSVALRDSAKPTALAAVQDALNVPGAGIEGVLAGRRHRLGKPAFVADLAGALPADGQEALSHYQQAGLSLVALGCEGQWLALFALGDRLRADAVSALRQLREMGYAVTLLSGDHAGAVALAAAEVGVDDWRADLGPQDKLVRLHEMQAKGAVVCMLGDGVNDAPVLAGAQVSMAMGAGTALARNSADMVLLSNRLRDVPFTLRMARDTHRIIRQNLTWALVYNILALPAAMAGLLQPWMAAIGMSLSSLVVVANAMRLARGSRAESSNPTASTGAVT